MAGGAYYWWARSGPLPPEPDVAGLDPAVVEVLRDCHQAVRRSPRSGDSWGKLGMALLVYDFQGEAVQCFEHAERFSPSDPRWPYFHGIAMLPRQTEAALEKLRRAVSLSDDGVQVTRLRLANILSELGHYDEAEQYYRAVLKVSSDHPGAVFGLGRLAFARGQFKDSLESLNHAAHSPYTARSAHQLLVAVHTRLGDTDSAMQAQARLADLPDDRPMPDPFTDQASTLRTGLRAWVDDGGRLVRQGKVSRAKPLALLAIEKYPDSAEAWMLMARIYLAEQNASQALSAARKAVELSPDAVEPHIQLGVTLLYQRRVDEAIARFTTAIDLKPELSEAHHNLGLCYAEQQSWPKAIDCFQEAKRLNPGFVDSHLALANALARQGQAAEAVKAAEEALKLRPNDARALRFLDQYRSKDDNF